MSNDDDRKMSDKDMLYFVKPCPKAYRRYLRNKTFKNTKKFLTVASEIILWICAVGGFILSLVQFFSDN